MEWLIPAIPAHTHTESQILNPVSGGLFYNPLGDRCWEQNFWVFLVFLKYTISSVCLYACVWVCTGTYVYTQMCRYMCVHTCMHKCVWGPEESLSYQSLTPSPPCVLRQIISLPWNSPIQVSWLPEPPWNHLSLALLHWDNQHVPPCPAFLCQFLGLNSS